MNLTNHIQKVIGLSEKLDKLEEKTNLLKSEPMVDIIFNAILKVGKKENVDNKILLIKRYLRRYYNIDMDSKSIQTRLKNLMK